MSLWEMIKFILPGAGITFQLAPVCIIATLILGMIIGILMFKNIPGMNVILAVYKVVMRGVPALVILRLLYYSADFSSAFFAAFISLTLYHSAYIGEIIRGCFESIPKGQMMAGESLGLGYWKIMTKIYIPQILRPMIPMLCGQYILLVKDTTLVYIVGVMDLMWRGRQLMAMTFNPLTGYLLIGVVYYVLCALIEFFAHSVERKISSKSVARRLSSYF